MPRGTRKTYIKKKNTRNKKNIRKQRRTRGGVDSVLGKRNRHDMESIPEECLPPIPEKRLRMDGIATHDEDEERAQLTEIQSKACAYDAEAQSQLGTVYFYGLLGVEKNDVKAMHWFEMAADKGYADAQYNLGMMYKNGQGVKQSDDNAMQLFKKAANQGHANAQYNLGVMYSRGQGVAQDFSKAMELYAKAAEQGHACACDALPRTRILDEILKEKKEKILKSKGIIESCNLWWKNAKRRRLVCAVQGGKKTAKRRHKRRRKTSTRRRR